MGLVMLGPILIPAPEGVDMTSFESMEASMHLMQPLNFLPPFVAHAMGTLTGAWLVFRLAPAYKAHLAYVIGLLFLAGGIMAATMIPAPLWFIAADLILAYFPMAALAIHFSRRQQN